MEPLGHSQVSLTLDTYSHVLRGLQAEAAKRMDDAIGCQIGCQEENGVPLDAQEVADSLGKVVSLTFASWNRVADFLNQVHALRRAT